MLRLLEEHSPTSSAPLSCPLTQRVKGKKANMNRRSSGKTFDVTICNSSRKWNQFRCNKTSIHRHLSHTNTQIPKHTFTLSNRTHAQPPTHPCTIHIHIHKIFERNFNNHTFKHCTRIRPHSYAYCNTHTYTYIYFWMRVYICIYRSLNTRKSI